MKQLTLAFHETRFEIPSSHTSWREGDRLVRVYVGEHSIDESWPWWTPGAPWKP